MSKPRFRRREWLIDNEVQVGLGIRLALCLAGYLALFLSISLFDPISTVLWPGPDEAVRAAAAQRIRDFLSSTGGPLLIATACMILHSVLLLHRVAGPVLRLRRGFESIRDRDLTKPIHLRKGDLLNTAADRHNEAVATVRADVESLRREAEAALALLEGDAPDATALRQRLDAIAAVARSYRVDGDAAPAGSEAVVESRDAVSA